LCASSLAGPAVCAYARRAPPSPPLLPSRLPKPVGRERDTPPSSRRPAAHADPELSDPGPSRHPRDAAGAGEVGADRLRTGQAPHRAPRYETHLPRRTPTRRDGVSRSPLAPLVTFIPRRQPSLPWAGAVGEVEQERSALVSSPFRELAIGRPESVPVGGARSLGQAPARGPEDLVRARGSGATSRPKGGRRTGNSHEVFDHEWSRTAGWARDLGGYGGSRPGGVDRALGVRLGGPWRGRIPLIHGQPSATCCANPFGRTGPSALGADGRKEFGSSLGNSGLRLTTCPGRP